MVVTFLSDHDKLDIFVEDLTNTTPSKFGFNWASSFRVAFVEDHINITPSKFASNQCRSFRIDVQNVKGLRPDDW
jgi:hypothetical protein